MRFACVLCTVLPFSVCLPFFLCSIFANRCFSLSVDPSVLLLFLSFCAELFLLFLICFVVLFFMSSTRSPRLSSFSSYCELFVLSFVVVVVRFFYLLCVLCYPPCLLRCCLCLFIHFCLCVVLSLCLSLFWFLILYVVAFFLS